MKIGLIIAVIVLAILLKWSSLSSILRYKISVEVDTPSGTRSGSAVRSVGLVSAGFSDVFHVADKGEAVVVDLPYGQKLFVLLVSDQFDVDNWKKMPRIAFFEYWKTNKKYDDNKIYRKIAWDRPTADIWPIQNTKWAAARLPMMVKFADLSDPASVQQVDPDHLDRSFGAGYRLKRIVVSVTRERVSRRIVTVLPWLKTHGGALIPGRRRTEPGVGHRITPRNFFKDESK